MYCPQREENHRRREAGERVSYANPAILEAWKNSRDAKSLVQELEARGFDVAQGRKRLVVVDPYGKSTNPIRDLKAALGNDFKEQDFRDRLAGLDPASLPTPEAVRENRAAEEERLKEQQRAFEQKTSALLGRQTEKHREERYTLTKRHNRREELKRTELESYHRTSERQEQIVCLHKELERPGLIRKIGFVLFRTDRKIKQGILEAELQQADARQRIKEALGKLEVEREQDAKRLEKRHLRETEELMDRLEQWRPGERKQRSVSDRQSEGLFLKPDGPSLDR